MKTVFLFVILILCCLACNKEQVTQPHQQTPYEQWHALKIHNYSIDQSLSCFCPNAGELVRITVRSDTIASVIRISDASIVMHPFYCAIDGLFRIIQDHSYDSIVVRYNTQYGYPEYLDVNPQSHPVDGGFLCVTSNFQAQLNNQLVNK